MSKNRHILIICNTYYQLVFACQLRRTFFNDEKVDIWLSDHSINANLVADRLRETRFFTDVRYQKTKQRIYTQSILTDIWDVLKTNFGKIRDLDIPLYDEILFYNLTPDMFSLADFLKQHHKNVIWSHFEEGILSYNQVYYKGLFNRLGLAMFFRRFTSRDNILSNISQYYCTNPEFMTASKGWKLFKVPHIAVDDLRIRDVLNYIFDYKPQPITQKYIFFASSSDIDGSPFGETEIILDIADRVGSENLLVKMHPRDNRHVYEDKGITVMRNSFVPWEIMQMNMDTRDKIFLCVTSGAFLSASVILGQESRGFFLYPSVKGNTDSLKKRFTIIQNNLDNLHKAGLCQGIREIEVGELFD